MGDLIPYKPRELERDRQGMPALRFAPRPPSFAKRFAQIIVNEISAQNRDMTKVGLEVHSEHMDRKRAKSTDSGGQARAGQGNIYIDNRGGQVRIFRRRDDTGSWLVALLLIAIVLLLGYIGSQP